MHNRLHPSSLLSASRALINTAALLLGVTGAMLIPLTAPAQSVQILRQTSFEAATIYTESQGGLCPGTLVHFDVTSPDIGGTSAGRMWNDLKGNDHQAWISPTNHYGTYGYNALGVRLNASWDACQGGQKMAYFYNNVGHLVPGSTAYMQQFGHVRYTGFAMKLGAGNPGEWGYFESPIHPPHTNTKYVHGTAWCLMAQWRQDLTPGGGSSPPLALMLANNSDPGKVTYQVRTSWGSTDNPTVNINVRYPFQGSLTKGVWHTFIFETKLGATGTVAGVPASLGHVRLWVNGVLQTVKAGTSDANPSTTTTWDGYIGYKDGSVPSAAFLLGPYRSTAYLNQTVFFDKVRIARMSNNGSSSLGYFAVDPSAW